jgi:hypothetical protein
MERGNAMKPGIYRPQLSFEGNFTTIPNNWIRNTGLSVKANFLLIYLLTHEVGYNITFSQIEREIELGETAIRNAMEELKDAGWLRTERTTDKRGYNAGLAWFLSEPSDENPTLANPDLANPALEKRGALENNLTKKTTIKEIYTSDFQNFYNSYPRKVGKQAALKAFVKALEIASVDEILSGAIRFAHDPNLPVEQFIPHPATWLNAGRWEDGPLPERQMTPEEREARQLADLERRRERDRKHSEELREQERLARANAEAAPRCEHGRIIAACMPCIKAGKV